MRHLVQTAGGTLLFGAGLLHLAAWRSDRALSRGGVGALLVVLGLSITLLSGAGSLLQAGRTAVVLNPFSITIATFVAFACATALASRWRRVGHPYVATALGLAGVFAFYALGSLAHVTVGFLENPGAPWLIGVELVTALCWFAAAAVTARSGARSWPHELGAAILLTMGLRHLLRCLAVLALWPWAIAAALLLAVVGGLVFAQALRVITGSAQDDALPQPRDAEPDTVTAPTYGPVPSQRTAPDPAEQRHLRHDTRNSLFALKLATSTLRDHGERLPAEDRQRLSSTMVDELTRLEHLIAEATGGGSPRATEHLTRPDPEGAHP